MNPPDNPSTLAWIADKAWAAGLLLIGVVWTQNRSAMASIKEESEKGLAAQRLESEKALQAHKEEDQRLFQSIHQEQALQRGYFAKVFDELKDMRQHSEQRHVEVLTALHTGLNQKADKP